MITKVKGTQDILPNEIKKWQDLENVIFQVSKLYHFEEIRTPIFENSELFHRGVGDTTDIIKKETYDFLDRGDRSITLRPEGTASVVRTVIENKLYANPNLPLKFYYYGPMFRYERPQKGRQRQFHQFGAEALGSASPLVDAEMIAYSYTLLKALRLKNVSVKINSLGDTSSKETYKEKLTTYLSSKVDTLCTDCQRRYLENPYRVLDCKVDKDSDTLKEAPKPIDYLNDEDKTHFEQVCSYLDGMHIEYVVDKNLVRGLDYYTHTVFELEAALDTLGAQATLGGGGRYNHLFSTLGGPNFPAVGFAFGMERLLLALESLEIKEPTPQIHAFMIMLGDNVKAKALEVILNLRHGGLLIDYDFFDHNLKAQFKQAERQNPKFLLIFGEDEMNKGVINVKNIKTGEQIEVGLNELYTTLITEIQNEQHSCAGHCEECDEDC
ncbi:MAG: histidine--tRNA ligase [Candidatus Izemoplasmatales bacterium]|jgi:histidyl-tRNA synthetase|nr:histidine--tRNA ligase [Candidatus Izemoplasmatales bacterium]